MTSVHAVAIMPSSAPAVTSSRRDGLAHEHAVEHEAPPPHSEVSQNARLTGLSR